MLSRVAESIYWMSRYVERAENVARCISVNLNLSLDLPGVAGDQWSPLVVTMGDADTFYESYSTPGRSNVIEFLTFDRSNPNSILSCLTSARENARSVRESISSEMWQHLNAFYLRVRDARREEAFRDPHTYFDGITAAGQQFVGVTDVTMTHGEGWHFGQLGRMIERADKTSRILDVKYFILLPHITDVGTTYDNVQWLALLRSASGLEMYRQAFGRIDPSGVVQFLILDRDFPRAVLHCLTRADKSLHEITGTNVGGFSCPPEQLLGMLRSKLAFTTAEKIIEGGLHEFVDDLQRRLNEVGGEIAREFFLLPLAASAT